MIASVTPRVWSIKGSPFSRLCVNIILIICDLSALVRSHFLIARISFTLVIVVMMTDVFVPTVAKNTRNG